VGSECETCQQLKAALRDEENQAFGRPAILLKEAALALPCPHLTGSVAEAEAKLKASFAKFDALPTPALDAIRSKQDLASQRASEERADKAEAESAKLREVAKAAREFQNAHDEMLRHLADSARTGVPALFDELSQGQQAALKQLRAALAALPEEV
jgi:hypothetical protein